MRSHLMLYLLFAGHSCFGQTGRCTLKIDIGDCRIKPMPMLQYHDTFYLYKDTASVRTIIPDRQQFGRPLYVNNLSAGQYHLRYKNLFGQSLEKRIDLVDTGTTCSICPDQLASQPLNTLARLQDKENLFLFFKETACFSTTKERITFTRRHKQFYATLNDRSGDKTTIRLNKSQQEEFVRFENELHALRPRGRCTTVDYYTISSNYGLYTREDGSCNWEGYDHLRQALFGER